MERAHAHDGQLKPAGPSRCDGPTFCGLDCFQCRDRTMVSVKANRLKIGAAIVRVNLKAAGMKGFVPAALFF
jgi:hypothetical protein